MGRKATEDIWILRVEEFRLIHGGFDPRKPTVQDKTPRADNVDKTSCRQFDNLDQILSVLKLRRFSS